MTAALWWAIAAAVLVVIEVATLDLLFAMLAVGAVAGALAAMADQPVVVQCLVAAGVALLMLLFVRPVALRHLRQPAAARTNVDALLGAPAIVLAPVDRDQGQVKIGGEVWSARTDAGATLEIGSRVGVIRIEGATAIVRAAPTQQDAADPA